MNSGQEWVSAMSQVTQVPGVDNQANLVSGQSPDHADAASWAMLHSRGTRCSLQFKVNEHSRLATCPSLFRRLLSCAPVPRASVWQVTPIEFGELNQILGWECDSRNPRI